MITLEGFYVIIILLQKKIRRFRTYICRISSNILFSVSSRPQLWLLFYILILSFHILSTTLRQSRSKSSKLRAGTVGHANISGCYFPRLLFLSLFRLVFLWHSRVSGNMWHRHPFNFAIISHRSSRNFVLIEKSLQKSSFRLMTYMYISVTRM